MTTAAAVRTLKGLINADVEFLTEFRRDLHRHPELAYDERRTAGSVVRELERAGIEHVAGLAGGTGVVAHLPPTDACADRPAVALRADMDALPIVEETGLPYASATGGVMHACGHDGHTTILLGAARALARLEERTNPVTFVFQPAEEGGAGAARMIDDGCLDGSRLGPPVGRMFGLHGWPQLEVGKVSTMPGPLMAATDTFRVVVRGVQAHGAYPHLGNDTVLAAAHCITALQSIASRSADPLEPVVVSVGAIKGGTAENILPSRVEFIGTTRTLRDDTRAMVRARFHEIVSDTASALGCAAEVHWEVGYPVTTNDPDLTAWTLDLARAVLGEHNVVVRQRATMGGEDFSFYAQRVPACFFYLGLCRPGRPHPQLHQPDFDFNDDAIATGVEIFCRLALA